MKRFERTCEPWQTNLMCAGPQGSDLLTINDKVSGIFRVKDICHADPAFQNGL